jgi:hypothetical protein
MVLLGWNRAGIEDVPTKDSLGENQHDMFPYFLLHPPPPQKKKSTKIFWMLPNRRDSCLQQKY